MGTPVKLRQALTIFIAAFALNSHDWHFTISAIEMM
jgi:hypothetical protein